MNETNKNDLIEYRIERAKQTLNEAKTMIDNKYWNAAVNRLYYACFYAVLALLLKSGIKTQTHAGVRQMFGLHYIKTGIISREFGKFYTDMFDKRQTGDYDDFFQFDEETLNEIYPTSIEFIDVIDKLISGINE